MSVEIVKPNNERSDYQKFFIERGDPNFSPQHNKFVIDSSIKKNMAIRKARRKVYDDKLAERVSAATSYIFHLEKGNSTPAEKYFGRRLLTYLRGKKILQRIAKNTGRIILEEIS